MDVKTRGGRVGGARAISSMEGFHRSARTSVREENVRAKVPGAVDMDGGCMICLA